MDAPTFYQRYFFDGVIALGMVRGPGVVRALAQSRIPVVGVCQGSDPGAIEPDLPTVARVVTDNREGIRIVLRHLMGFGHNKDVRLCLGSRGARGYRRTAEGLRGV